MTPIVYSYYLFVVHCSCKGKWHKRSEQFCLTLISLILKGLDHASTGINLVSTMIKEALEIPHVSVLMGANLAKEVAREMFGEATIGNIRGD